MKKLSKPEASNQSHPSPPLERSKLLEVAVQSIHDYGIFLLDPEGFVMTWNEGAERIKGYSEREIIGKHFSIFYTQPDLDRKYPYYELKEAKKVGRYEDEGWRVRKDGSQFWASVIITKLVDKKGKLLGFSKVTRDLSDKRAAEEKLKLSEMRFRLLVESVKDYAIFGLDTKGCVTSWNEGARRIKGYEANEIIGKHFSIFYDPNDVKEGRCDYELAEAELTGRFEDEGWRIRKDGTRLWANVVITAIRDKNNKLIGYSKVTRDLTERKRSEDKVARAYQDLERRIRHRTAELSQANEALKRREQELEEALRTRDDFLSIASHELKTPITSLKMQIQMMRQRVKAGLSASPEKTMASLDVSLRQITRLTALIEDLLDVARAGSKKLSFHFELVNLSSLVQEVSDRLADELHHAGCTLEISADENVQGYFDRFRIDQVIVNLLTNAIKYAAGSKIRISVTESNATACLVVSDQGPGIPPGKHEAIFERFERASASRNISGLGLGLFISKQIVEGHHGTIHVESEPGQGATFIIEMPMNLVPVMTSKAAQP